MPPPHQRAERFTYDGYTIDPARGEVACTYSTGGRSFTERFVFGTQGNWNDPAVEAAVRILFLLAGVSYFKTTAAEVIDLGTTTSSADERAFLTAYYVNGLAEFAYQNDVDLHALRIEGPEAPTGARPEYVPLPQRPLIPFGGGIDSIVTVEALKRHVVDVELCVVHPPGQRFAAIEDAASVTGLPVVRITREIDPLVRRSEELGFLNGHVPITAVITATSLVKAVLDRRDAVIMSNEWSASVPTLIHDGRPVNHQWSKSIEFEEGFAQLVAASLGSQISVFSYLRSRSELWVAEQFAQLRQYHSTFRSCNRAFHQERSDRLSYWCGTCPKCCFIDLILAPFLPVEDLQRIFGGNEPLENPDLFNRFYDLMGLDPEDKPFECVGDIDECRAALAFVSLLRPDNVIAPSLAEAVHEEATTGSIFGEIHYQTPRGPHHIPERYVPSDLLVLTE
jgi:hypothetical protein